EAEAVGAGDGDAPVVDSPHPRDRRAVVEADHELRAHLDLSAQPLDYADDVGRYATRRHEVDQTHGAAIRLPLGLEHERARPVATAGLPGVAPRRDDPAAVLLGPEQGCKARA